MALDGQLLTNQFSRPSIKTCSLVSVYQVYCWRLKYNLNILVHSFIQSVFFYQIKLIFTKQADWEKKLVAKFRGFRKKKLKNRVRLQMGTSRRQSPVACCDRVWWIWRPLVCQRASPGWLQWAADAVGQLLKMSAESTGRLEMVREESPWNEMDFKMIASKG